MDLAVDLARSEIPTDALLSPSGLSRWLGERRDVLGPASEEVALRLPQFRALREAIGRTFGAALGGRPLPPDAVAALNAASAAAPGFPRLDASDRAQPVATTATLEVGRTAEIIAAIARSAIAIVGGPERTRLRVCEAPSCGRFFVAGRPDQVWCSSACGNRARVARHYARAGR